MKKLLALSLACTLLAAGPTARAADAAAEANKKLVVAFYEAALMRGDTDALAQYLGPRYIQHNPMAPDGAEGLKGYIGFLKEKFPQRSSEIKRVIADGDLVVLHVHAKPTPDARGSAIVDIFRVENGRIVEHWDVIQPVPEKPANNNTMF